MNRSFIMLLALVIFLGAGFGGSFVGGVIYGENRAANVEDELSPRLGAGGQFPGGGQGANAGQRGQGQRGQGGGDTTAAQGQRGGFGGGQGQSGPAARQGGGPGNSAGVPAERSQGQSQDVATAQQQGDMGRVGQGRGSEGAPVARSAGQVQGDEESRQVERPGRDGQGDAAPAQPGANDNATNSSLAAASNETEAAAEESPQDAANRGGAAGTVQGLEGDVLMLASPRGDLAVTLSVDTRVFQVSEAGRESLAADTRVRVMGSRNPEGGIAALSVVIVPEGAEDLFAGAGRPGGRQRCNS